MMLLIVLGCNTKGKAFLNMEMLVPVAGPLYVNGLPLIGEGGEPDVTDPLPVYLTTCVETSTIGPGQPFDLLMTLAIGSGVVAG